MSIEEIRAVCIFLAIIISLIAFKLKLPGADVILVTFVIGCIYLTLSYFNLMTSDTFLPVAVIAICGFIYLRYRKKQNDAE